MEVAKLNYTFAGDFNIMFNIKKVIKMKQKVIINHPNINVLNARTLLNSNEHYNKQSGRREVASMSSVNENGIDFQGEFWIIHEILNIYRGLKFPAHTTEYDKYTAVNFIFHKLHDKYSDEQIVDITYKLFFANKEISNGEVWKFINGSC